MAYDLHDPAFRLFFLISVGSQLCHHLMTIYCIHRTILGDKNILKNFWMIRQHKTVFFPGAYLIKTNHFFHTPVQDPDHLSFSVSSPLCLKQNNFYPITVHGSCGLICSNVNVRCFTLCRHKSKSFLIGTKKACQMLFLADTVFSPFTDSDLSFHLQGFQHFF